MCVSRRGSGVAEEKMAPELPVTVLVQGELPKGLLLREFAYDFFFSSRRRHTRLQGDWSSDGALPIWWCAHHCRAVRGSISRPRTTEAIVAVKRSEERRVGKECRFRWWPYH